MHPTYIDYFNAIAKTGRRVAPRGLAVRELDNARLTYHPGEMLGRVRINHRIGLMEGLMFVGGFFDVELIKAVAPNARLDLFTPQAAYGPRTASQLPVVAESLKQDPLSRRAVVTLIGQDEVGSPGAPCTLVMGFTTRNGMLSTTTVMRSSDAVWGLPYDITQFGLVAQVMARVLGASPATSVVDIINAHIYDDTAHLTPLPPSAEFTVTRPFTDWAEAQAWAREQTVLLADRQQMRGLIVRGEL